MVGGLNNRFAFHLSYMVFAGRKLSACYPAGYGVGGLMFVHDVSLCIIISSKRACREKGILGVKEW